jgi:hypothetical protein
MKLSRRAGLILGAVAIVGALIAAYVIYSGLAPKRSDLNQRLERAQTFLPILTNQKNDLLDQLARAQSTLDTSQSQFPQSVESIEYGEYLYEIAHDCNVELTVLSFPQPATRTVGDVTYSVVTLSLPVSGSLDNIFDFIEMLRTDYRFDSTEITAVSMTWGATTTTATIGVDIYAHKS